MKTRITFFLLVLGVFFSEKTAAQTEPQLGNPVNVFTQLTWNGFSPIPKFASKQTSVIGALGIPIYRGFHFDPDVAWNLETGNLWFLDLWFRYTLPLDSGLWEITAGYDQSAFFSPIVIGNDSLVETTHYSIFQLEGVWHVNNYHSLTGNYWYLLPKEDVRTVEGHYLSLNYQYKRSFWDKHFTVQAQINPFYLKTNEGTNGLFLTQKYYLWHQSGFFVGYQSVQGLTEKLKYTWDLTVGFSRDIY